jgi:hypothetical protein
LFGAEASFAMLSLYLSGTGFFAPARGTRELLRAVGLLDAAGVPFELERIAALLGGQ